MALARGEKDASTFIEDYVENISSLPHEIRRHFELMRDLDKEGAKVISDLEESERRVLADMRKTRRVSENVVESALSEISSKRRKAQQCVDEKVQIAEQACADCDIHIDRLDTELAKFEDFLRTSGEFTSASAAPGDQVAAKNKEDEWILARVQDYSIQTGTYVLVDEDDADASFEVPEALTVLLDGDRLSKGEEVFAVYPDTTSFYEGVVTSVPRRSAALHAAPGSAAHMALTCTVQFNDDVDETGTTPDRVVPVRYVFRRPEAALDVRFTGLV
mmetsp:Transcript_13953/g.33074  ORF Transcript_13953/g.33074 Transcript_13953/m.33074 type:complete len:275 (-) Transcript_13953:41-865(-)|eukprot:CAMPEP_0172616256 /NCGR_PEP_ID=MMETSP1068-20121228/63200_1 /TAXON_ID=35684 /ORGANISM="Pseudopedinella elastica, Strain CCMP716" /LENGTH=274 /DNA_ID=CAMNT_0013421631 /DNA_START=158 /DNA_END=982 /DNA_ORIENTATION=-